MNPSLYLFPFGCAVLGFGCASSPKRSLATPAVAETHNAHTFVYRFEDGIAVRMDSVEKESSGLNHVTIVGAVERAGAYYFVRKLKIESLIEAAKPIKTDIGCGSAYLTRVKIASSRRFENRDSFGINYLKYLAAEGKADRAPIELEGGEVVYIPEQL